MVSERVFEDLLIFEESVLDLVIFCTYIEESVLGMQSIFLFKQLFVKTYVFFVTVHLVYVILDLHIVPIFFPEHLSNSRRLFILKLKSKWFTHFCRLRFKHRLLIPFEIYSSHDFFWILFINFSI